MRENWKKINKREGVFSLLIGQYYLCYCVKDIYPYCLNSGIPLYYGFILQKEIVH